MRGTLTAVIADFEDETASIAEEAMARLTETDEVSEAAVYA